MSMEIGNLIVVLQMDSSKFEAGMSKVTVYLNGFQGAAKKASGDLGVLGGATNKATGYLDGFQGAAKIASGILMRDLVRGLTTGAVEALKMGAQIKTLETSFNALSRATDEYVPSLSELRTATKGMVSDTDLLLRANEALALGIPTENLDDLFDSAIRLGKAMGIDATQGIQALTIGVGRQSRLVLDNLGVIVRAESAYEEYAERVGKTTETLTENERRIAFQTVALEKISEKAAILGDNISDTDMSMAQWSATIKNTTTALGEMLQPLGAFTPALQTLGPSLGIMGAQILPTLSAATLGWAAAGALAVVGVVGLISVMRDYQQRTDEVAQAQNRFKDSLSAVDLATQEVEDAQQNLKIALSGQDAVYDALSSAIDRRAMASERLADAEGNLKTAENELMIAQQDLSAFLGYLSGDITEYTTVTGSMEYATLAAQMGITALSTELQTLQGIAAATSSELAGLEGQMTGLSDEEQGLNLRMLKVEDAFRDGRITQEEYTERVETLRGKLRNLNIAQAELGIQIRDTRREEEEQIETLSETQGNLDDLIAKNEEAVTVQEEVDSATEDVADARDEEIDAINDVKGALEDLETAHDNVVVAQDAARESAIREAAALRELERESLAVAAAERQRAQDQAFREQWQTPGISRDYMGVATGGGTSVTNVGPTTSSTINLNVNMAAPTSSPEAQQYANEFVDVALQELGRRGVMR